MSGKGSISRMSDECLMKQETVVSFYVVYQAVMRKFTLADISQFFPRIGIFFNISKFFDYFNLL